MIIYNIKTKAFTLVELIITITILAILATIAFINLGNYPANSRDAVRKSDLRTIEKAMTIYHIENGRYPTPDKDPVDGKTYFGEKAFQELGKINKLPLDPTTGKPYRYISLGVGYILVAALENGELFRVDHSRLAFQSCGMDYNSVMNKYGGKYNSSFSYNTENFTAMKADGTLTSWGSKYWWKKDTPEEKGFIKVFPSSSGFLAINPYGKVYSFGRGNLKDPEDEGFINIKSTAGEYTALKIDGSLYSWGFFPNGGEDKYPKNTGIKNVVNNAFAFLSINSSGELHSWGSFLYGGTSESGQSMAPEGNFKKIFASHNTFSALNNEGKIINWGMRRKEIIPPFSDIKNIYSNDAGYTAISTEGRLYSWSDINTILNAPTGEYYKVFPSPSHAFAAIKKDGTISVWGGTRELNITPPGNNYKDIIGNGSSFVAMRNDGTLFSWGSTTSGGTSLSGNTLAPSGTFEKVFANGAAFVALKSDGTLFSWGYKDYGGTGNNGSSLAPSPKPGNKFIKVFSNYYSFTAMDDKGCLYSWGHPDFGGDGAPTDCGRIEVNGSRVDDLEDCSQM